MRSLTTGSLSFLVVMALACSTKSTASRNDEGTAKREGLSLSGSPRILAAPASTAAWTQTSWSAGDDFFALASGQDWIFARIWDASNGGRTFLTTDSGTSWA